MVVFRGRCAMQTATFTNVSEVLTASIMIALTMEAVRTSETLVNFYQSTRRYTPDDSRLQMNNESITNTRLVFGPSD
jgi:hypothetical protein